MGFSITGKESIVVYGAGSRGVIFAELLCKRGFCVKAILDRKRKESVRLKEDEEKEWIIPVVNPEEYICSSREEIAIISLQNGRQHDSVAKILHGLGFEKIIYLPWAMEQNGKLMSNMRRIYNMIYEGDCMIQNIPGYLEIASSSCGNLMDKDGVIYMPFELLFMQSGSDFENVVNWDVMLDLYQYMDKAEGDCSDYLEEQVADSSCADGNRKAQLKVRYEMFEYFERAYEIHREFFEDSAPWVTWNCHGYFQCGDGRHRTFFLVHRGVRDIPVRVRDEDRQYIELWKRVNGVGNLWYESPYMLRREYSLFSRKLNKVFCYAIRRKDVFEKTIYIHLHDGGGLGRYCYRLGCSLCIDVESEETIKLAREISDVFAFSGRLEICTEMKTERDIDIAVLDEKYLEINEKIYARQYIIKLETHGRIYRQLVKRGLEFEVLDRVFDGDRIYLVVQFKNMRKWRNER